MVFGFFQCLVIIGISPVVILVFLLMVASDDGYFMIASKLCLLQDYFKIMLEEHVQEIEK